MSAAFAFTKTYNMIQMTKKALAKWNTDHATSIPLIWVNDYTNLMERSYPTAPAGWTSTRSYTTGTPQTNTDSPISNGIGKSVTFDPDHARRCI